MEALELGCAVGSKPDDNSFSNDGTSSISNGEGEEARLQMIVRDVIESLRIIERLLRGGLEANVCVDLGGNTAIHHACISGSQDQVRLLLSLNADPNLCNDDGCAQLQYAYTRTSKIAHKALNALDAGFKLYNGEEDSPLNAASGSTRETAADLDKLLLKHGADASVILHIAVSNGDKNMIRLLHEANADLNGMTPLQDDASAARP
jgi:ankyrin repeat protein